MKGVPAGTTPLRHHDRPTIVVVLEEMRIVEVETAGRKIRRTWSYEKKNVLPEVQEKPGTASSSTTTTTKAESEINLMENNSYKSKYSSPLAHRIKQNRIDQRERLHLN